MGGCRVDSFLLRLVIHERGPAGNDDWRGRIQHVASGCEQQFERLDDMVAFINEQIAGSCSMVTTCDERLSAE
jgi:hypothetical protein